MSAKGSHNRTIAANDFTTPTDIQTHTNIHTHTAHFLNINLFFGKERKYANRPRYKQRPKLFIDVQFKIVYHIVYCIDIFKYNFCLLTGCIPNSECN